MKTQGNKKSISTILKKINELPTSAILLDNEGNIIFSNVEFCKLTGHQNSELSKTTDVILEKEKEADSDSIFGEDIEICNLQHKSGKLIPVLKKEQDHKIEDIYHKVILFFTLSSYNNQEALQRYEEEILETRNIALENESELKAIFDNVPSIVVLFDAEKRIIRINNKGLIAFKASESEIIGKNLCEVLNCVEEPKIKTGKNLDNCCSECILRKVFERTIHNNEEINKKEISLSYLNNGKVQKRTILISTSLLLKHNKPLYLATVDDITIRKKMEKELIRAKDKAEESERLKTAFLENMSHEIRTPMNGLLGFANLLEKDNLSGDQRRRFVEIINTSGNRLMQTMDKIVEMSKLDSGVSTIEPGKFNLKPELNSFIKNYGLKENSENVIFVNNFEKNEKEIFVETDMTRLFQILKYLLDNAFKYTQKGFVILDGLPEKDFIIFSVKDTGIGISEENQKEIFKPFRQGQGPENSINEGNGLGLAIVKKLVEKLGGSLWLKSTPGKGSCFSFSIPYSSDIHPKYEQQENHAYKLKTDRTILIAENSSDDYNRIKSLISSEVLNTIHVKSIEEAVKITSRNKKIELIIINYGMLTGNERINEIMHFFAKNLPVIAYGEKKPNGAGNEWEKNENVEFIGKPLEQELFLKGIRKHLKEK